MRRRSDPEDYNSNMKSKFSRVIDSLTEYRKSTKLTDKQDHNLGEAIARLKTESKRYKEILNVNKNLLEESEQMNSLRQLMAPENIAKILTKEGFDTSKMSLVQTTELSSHNMENLEGLSALESKKMLKLHSETETHYRNLWAIILKLNQIPVFGNFKPKGVREVRNDLIEHSNSGSSNAYIFSFGLATKGPVLRPTKPTGVKAPNDKGLEVNVEEYLDSIIKTLDQYE